LKTIITALYLLILVCFPAFSQPKDALVNLPATPLGQHVQAYLRAFNSSDENAMREFFLLHTAKDALQQTPVEQRLSRFRQMKQRLGSLKLMKVVDSSPTLVSAVFQSRDAGLVQLDFEFEPNPPHGLVGIRVQDVEDGLREQPAIKPMANETQALDAARSLIDSLVKADEFSGVVLVARNGTPVFEKAYGYADRERNISNRIDTKFNLGSINKSFTATAIHQLAFDGKVLLNDPIGKYLSDYPNKIAAEKVTIQQLLDMTSGIGDFFGERYQATQKENLRTVDSYLPLFADKPLEFEPGAKRRYSNGGYVVLGAIIERTSGQDYYTYVREYIFKPAGMSETESFEKDKEVPNRALGYTRDRLAADAQRQSNYSTLPARGSSAGGGYSNAHDLLKFIVALKDGKLKSPDAEGGFAIAGGSPGVNACVEWNPKSEYSVIVLSNYDPPSAKTVARQIGLWLPR
jgi:CubicO group peptidase (beta-lactamase class C family)